jgi:hypothetical protein
VRSRAGDRLGQLTELRLGVHDLLDEANRSKVLRARRSTRVTVTTPPGRGQGCRAFGEAEYSVLPQITNGEAII